jgi:hypothetical protein
MKNFGNKFSIEELERAINYLKKSTNEISTVIEIFDGKLSLKCFDHYDNAMKIVICNTDQNMMTVVQHTKRLTDEA